MTELEQVNRRIAEIDVIQLNNSKKNNRIWIKTGKLDEELLKANDAVEKERKELVIKRDRLRGLKVGLVMR